VNTSTMRRMIAGCLFGLAIVAGPALAQPDRPAPPLQDRPHEGPPRDRGPGDGPRDRRPRDETPSTPEEMRERIERRLDMVRGEEARLQQALERLKDGATPDEIYQFLTEGPAGDDRRDRSGMGDRDRGPDGGPRGEPDADVPEEFRPEMAPRVMKFLEDRDPEMFRRLREARDRNPERFDSMIRERWPKIREKMIRNRIERNAQFDTRDQIREADRRTRELADRASGADGDERTRLLGELRTALEAQFDLHAENARSEIAMLQERISSLTAFMDEKLANRAREIEDRMAQLLEEKPRKGPDSEGAPSTPREKPAEPPSH